MKNRRIFVTTNDLKRLDELLSVAGAFNYLDRNDLFHLLQHWICQSTLLRILMR